MSITARTVQGELAGLMDSFTGAINRVGLAYAERRNRERDIHWLALQTAKEFGAMVLHSRIMIRKAREMDSLESIRKSSTDSYEEAEHYWGYRTILDWYLKGQPCEVPEMWGYGDFHEAGGPGPGLKQSLWPEHCGYIDLARRLAAECRSPWAQQVIRSNREGAAVCFHYVLSKLPATDEFMQRVTRHERSVAEDELHHGPELIEELSRTIQSAEELEEAIGKLTILRMQELRQRNEQFLHPLTPAELAELERDFRQKKVEPIPLFSAGVAI